VSLIRREFLWNVQRVLLTALLIVALAVVSVGVRLFVRVRKAADQPPPPTDTPVLANLPTAAPGGTPAPTPTPSPAAPDTPATPLVPSTIEGTARVGIVAGHWQNDVGAVCPDGLTEVEINRQVAERVAQMLQERGYEAEMLAEFSPRLTGYQAAALVSIHADACNIPEASGFKVARVSASSVPDVEDRLVACLSEHYARATGLPFHRNSITFDMTEYHAFYEIEPTTPAAIIEIGFMAADRRLLTRRSDRVAQGIVDGLICFLEP
jgi:N-acetylmuramoyl-L-alanine amidase